MSKNLNKFLSLFLSFCLIFEQSVFAQTIDLSHYFARNSAQTMPQSDKFRPLHLRYISYDSQANDFKVLLDKGDFFNQKTEKPKNEKTLELEKTTQELMKYFFIGLSLPNEKFWVNLRPDSPDDILDPDLEKTDIGRIFLEADLQLKKDTSGMTSPQTKEGKEYWDKLYKKAGELFSSENISIPTLTRPWIVPDEVIIRESPEGAYIYKATLKVMLEEDYLRSPSHQVTKSPVNQTEYSFNDPRLKELNEYSTQLIKETIIPKLTRQINTSRRYAPLRQVYYSLILAQWFKQSHQVTRSQSHQLPQNPYIKLIDSGKLITPNFSLLVQQPYDKQAYFKQYQQSFKDGEYNLQESIHTPMGQSIRRYMSGGITMPISEVTHKITGSGSPMLSRGLEFTKKYFIYLLASLPLTMLPQVSVKAGILPVATPEVTNDDLRPNNLSKNMILYKGRFFKDLLDKMQRLLSNKSALSRENNEIEEVIKSVRRDLVIATSNLSNLSADDLSELSNVWKEINKIYKLARGNIYGRQWLNENKIFMDVIAELAFRFFNSEQRTKIKTFEGQDIVNIVFSIFSDCILSDNKLKETYLTHILNSGPTNEAIKNVGPASYFSVKGRIDPDFNKKGLDFLRLEFGDKKYYSQDILKLNAPSYIKLYLWYSWAIKASLDDLKRDSVNIRNLAESFLEEYKSKSIRDIRDIFVEREDNKGVASDGRDSQVTGPIDYWQIANIIALAIDLYKYAELNNILAYDFTLQGDVILLSHLSGIELSRAEEANSKYKFGLNAAHDATMLSWFLTGAHEITHNATHKIWGEDHIDSSIAEFLADLNAFAYFQQKNWQGYNEHIENFIAETRYADKMSIVKNANGFSAEGHEAARAQLGYIKNFLEKKYGKVNWVALRNVVFKELEIERNIGLDELSRRVLAEITGEELPALEAEMPPGFSYRVFIPPSSSSPMDSLSASSAVVDEKMQQCIDKMAEAILDSKTGKFVDNFTLEDMPPGITIEKLTGGNRGSPVYKLSAENNDIVVKFFLLTKESLFKIELKGLERGKSHPLFQQLITSKEYADMSVGYIVTEFIPGKSFSVNTDLWGFERYQDELKRYSDTLKKEFEGIPQEHWEQLVLMYREADRLGITIDANPANLKYDKTKGFTALDYFPTIKDIGFRHFLDGEIIYKVTGIPEHMFGENNELVDFIKNNIEKAKKTINKKIKTGGIDLSRINKSIRTESVSSSVFGGGNSPVDADFDVNEELIRLQQLLNAEIIPSADRLNRYARAACASSPSSPDSKDSALSLIAETFRLQENKAAPAAPELKDLAAWLE